MVRSILPEHTSHQTSIQHQLVMKIFVKIRLIIVGMVSGKLSQNTLNDVGLETIVCGGGSAFWTGKRYCTQKYRKWCLELWPRMACLVKLNSTSISNNDKFRQFQRFASFNCQTVKITEHVLNKQWTNSWSHARTGTLSFVEIIAFYIPFPSRKKIVLSCLYCHKK